MAALGAWRCNEPVRPGWRALWAVQRETAQQAPVVAVLARRAVKGRVQGTLLGFGWTLLVPALLFGVYALVFGVFLRVEVAHYPLFLLAGLLPWHWFAQSLQSAADTFAEEGRLLTRAAIAPQCLPLAGVLAHGTSFAVALPLLAGAALATGDATPASLLALIPIGLAQGLFTAGLALPLAAASIRFRDLRVLAPTALLAWFFATPIAYPPSLVPAVLAPLLWLNPFHPFASAWRDALYRAAMPSAPTLLALAALALASWVGGSLLFETLRARAVEEI